MRSGSHNTAAFHHFNIPNIIVDNGVCKARAQVSIKEVSDEKQIIHIGLAFVHAAQPSDVRMDC